MLRFEGVTFRPSRVTRSPSATFVPIAVTGAPLIVTLAWRMRVSQLRREPTPHLAR
jgi:hypothetical protein